MSENDYILSIIAKQLKGLASAEEIQELHAWLHADTGNQRHYDDLMNIWHSSEGWLSGPQFNTSNAWTKIEGQLNNLQAANPTPAPAPVISLLAKRVAIAIVLLAALGLITWWWMARTTWQTVTAIDGNQHITLPDQSTVHLRQGSTIRFPEQFAANERLIELTGEAFFDVQHNKQRPFRISTPHSAIQVLGTSFLVHTNDNTDEVVVVTGRVQVQDKNKNNNQVVVPAGQRVLLRQHRFTQNTVTDSNFIAWQTGRLDFENAPLQKVLDDLAHNYGVAIVLDPAAGPAATPLRVTVRFDNQPLDQALEEIRLITGLTLKKEDGKITLYQK